MKMNKNDENKKTILPDVTIIRQQVGLEYDQYFHRFQPGLIEILLSSLYVLAKNQSASVRML